MKCNLFVFFSEINNLSKYIVIFLYYIYFFESLIKNINNKFDFLNYYYSINNFYSEQF